LIYHYPVSQKFGTKRYELFNLADDPFEARDLASSQPAVLRKMVDLMIRQLDGQRAQYPVDKDGKTPLRPKQPE
jgi:hypothetical protein